MARFTNGDITIETDTPSERVELRGQGFREETAAELEARTVPELKAELKAVGQPTEGNKAELVDRLTDGGKPAKAANKS